MVLKKFIYLLLFVLILKDTQADTFSTITASLGLAPEHVEYMQQILENAIGFFDEMLGLELEDKDI